LTKSIIDKVDDTVYSYATVRQMELIDAVRAEGSILAAAKKLGITPPTIASSIKGLLSRVANIGHAPSHNMTKTVPDGFKIARVSSYYNKEGGLDRQWVIGKPDAERQHEMLVEAIKAACQTIPRLKPISYKGPANAELLNMYTITDYHIGMLADGDENGGDDWNIQIAENTLIGAFSHLIANSPQADDCVINQMGDFLHFDGHKPVTPGHGHVLDADSKFHKMIRVAIKCLRALVDMALTKHKTVHLICAEGNHDMASAHWLQEMFYVLYENDPRVTVDNSPRPYYCVVHGLTMLTVHHGHLKGKGNLLSILPSIFPKQWGSTEYRYSHEGHMHHKEINENKGMIREMHQTLAAADAYSSRGGYVSERGTTCITYSKKFGEVSRITVRPSMLL
jgi:hypothetical protein